MKVYKSKAPDIDLPELDLLTFLFGKSVNTLWSSMGIRRGLNMS